MKQITLAVLVLITSFFFSQSLKLVDNKLSRVYYSKKKTSKTFYEARKDVKGGHRILVLNTDSTFRFEIYKERSTVSSGYYNIIADTLLIESDSTMSDRFRNKMQRRNRLFCFDVLYVKRSYLIKNDKLEYLKTFYVRKKLDKMIRL